MELSDKLQRLERNIHELETLREELTVESLQKHLRYEWEIRYGLLESIQILIDVACKVTVRFNLGNPRNYKECLELLAHFGYLDRELSERTIAMVGLRNLLVHEYAQIDTQKLLSFLENLDDFRRFITEIASAFPGA
ncbi:HepT-like ribonuclease domain-containing protein [Nitratifractor sp.]|uniref:type VII toxin-antitoxin system HepT family RNase toxin n=1 Tax=Nitratifractor sp. TaxID=2268144 RepID=UPI0025DA9CA3|nr:HepT-like ribonuclease domain-containing protein [Nitratifractor sp.]